MFAESSPWVQIAVALIGVVGLIVVALIGVMFKVNAVRNDKQDHDHAVNHAILTDLQAAVVNLQNQHVKIFADHEAQAALQAEQLKQQKESTLATLAAAASLKEETARATAVVTQAVLTATALLAQANVAIHPPATSAIQINGVA